MQAGFDKGKKCQDQNKETEKYRNETNTDQRVHPAQGKREIFPQGDSNQKDAEANHYRGIERPDPPVPDGRNDQEAEEDAEKQQEQFGQDRPQPLLGKKREDFNKLCHEVPVSARADCVYHTVALNNQLVIDYSLISLFTDFFMFPTRCDILMLY